MNEKQRKMIARRALETARLVLLSPSLCEGTKCVDCPFCTDKGECIAVVICELANKAEKRVCSEK